MTEVAPWVRRFTATSIGFPRWTEAEPDRLAVISNRSGSSQVWAVNLGDGPWRQISDEPVGVETAWALPDGRVAWWRDTTGDERGALVAAPFDGGDVARVFPDLADGWLMGLSFEAGRAAISIEVEGTYRTSVIEPDGSARELASSERPAGVGSLYPTTSGGLSSDGTLACLAHAEHGDILHNAMRVLNVDTGDIVGDLEDKGRNLAPVAWSPVPGDQRLAFTSEQGAFERPAIWDVVSGRRRDLEFDVPGGAFPIEWFPDASALLVRHEYEGAAQLLRVDVGTPAVTELTELRGDIEEARIRQDGAIWYSISDPEHPTTILDTDGRTVLQSPDEPPPAGRRYESRFATNASGDRIHMFVVTPDGEGPFPTVCNIHGGPEWHERDRFDPETQAFVDNGYAVALINYRGSTGYGIAFREALLDDVCFTETEDILACVDRLVADGVTDPDRVFWNGWSWGGCLACFNAGTQPDRWRAIFAGIPAGDFVAAHWASAPELQAWDEAAHGGTPDQVPDRYARSNPMTYVDAVRAPVLVIAGEADPRCPIEGVTPWVDALRARNHPIDVELYPEGHHTNSTEGQVRHMQMVLDFFDRYR